MYSSLGGVCGGSLLTDVILSVKWEERSGAENKDEVGGVEILRRCE